MGDGDVPYLEKRGGDPVRDISLFCLWLFRPSVAVLCFMFCFGDWPRVALNPCRIVALSLNEQYS